MVLPMKIGVAEVYHHEPVALLKERKNSLQSHHPETTIGYELVEASEVQNRTKRVILFWN